MCNFDGLKLFICVLVVLMDCVCGDNCFVGLLEDVGVLMFMCLDFVKKIVNGFKVIFDIILLDKVDG